MAFSIMDETMNKRPAFQFYPADWRKDPQLQMCDMATQGIWINLLCCMWESDEVGKVIGTWEDFARLLGIPIADFKRFYLQAKRHKFADVTNSDGVVTIINRRIYTAFLERERAKRGMRKTREHRRYKQVTPHSSSSTSSSKKESIKKESPPPRIWSLEDVKTAAVQVGLTEQQAKTYYNHYDGQGWLKGNGLPITNLLSAMTEWRNNEYRFVKGSEVQSTSGPCATCRKPGATMLVSNERFCSVACRKKKLGW